MSEFDKILNNKEKIAWEGKPNSKNYFALIAIFGILSLIGISVAIFGFFFSQSEFSVVSIYALILGFVFLVITFLRILQYRLLAYAVTNNRVVIQSGIIGADYKSIDFDKIQEINVDVDLIGKIFKTGNIQFKTAGVNVVQTRYGQNVVNSTNSIAYVENPYELVKKIRELAKLDKKQGD